MYCGGSGNSRLHVVWIVRCPWLTGRDELVCLLRWVKPVTSGTLPSFFGMKNSGLQHSVTSARTPVLMRSLIEASAGCSNLFGTLPAANTLSGLGFPYLLPLDEEFSLVLGLVCCSALLKNCV